MEEENVTLETQEEKVENVQTEQENRCSQCQALIENGQIFCSECGTLLKRVCLKCGAELHTGQAFCTKCGQKADENQVRNNSFAVNQFNANVATKQRKNKLVPIIIGAACIVAIAKVLLSIKIGNEIDFEKKFSDISSEIYCEIAEDGSWMKLDTNPLDIDDYYNRDAWDAIGKVNTALGFSDSLKEKMGQTRSLDGRQSDENDKVRVSWTYHPDDGLEVMYEKK